MTPDRKNISGGMRSLATQLRAAEKQPAIGITQGGSSRSRGAKPAATTGPKRPPKTESEHV